MTDGMTYEEAIKAIKIKEMKIECKADRYAEFLEGLMLAREALEKQIQKKPTGKKFLGMSGFHIGYCPTCKSPINEELAYCDACGQAIDWSSEDGR